MFAISNLGYVGNNEKNSHENEEYRNAGPIYPTNRKTWVKTEKRPGLFAGQVVSRGSDQIRVTREI